MSAKACDNLKQILTLMTNHNDIATQMRCDYEIFRYCFSRNLCGKRIIKICEKLAKLRTRRLLALCARCRPVRYCV